MIQAKREPEGQRLSLKSHWTACPTLLQSSVSSNSLPAKSPVLCWVLLPAGPMTQGLIQPWMVPSQMQMCKTWWFLLACSVHLFSVETTTNCPRTPCPFSMHRYKTNQSKGVARKKRLISIIIFQQIALKTTQLEETEHICDGTSQPSPWHPNHLHPFLCKIAPTSMGVSTLALLSSRWCISKARGNEEWIIMHYNAA